MSDNSEYERCVRGGCCDLRDTIDGGKIEEPQKPESDNNGDDNEGESKIKRNYQHFGAPCK